MLRELKVRNFAIVEDGALELGTGMTAFTGETGAGKSLLLDAITLLLGAKARSDLVRAGARSAEVEGLFDLSRDPDKSRLAADLGFEIEEGSFLFVRREISGEVGRNRIWIQGRSATRGQLQSLLGDWVEVSGQHEFLRLGREDYLLQLIDQYGGLRDEARALAETFAEWQKLRAQLQAAREKEQNREARMDYLRFQAEEFERAGINAESEKDEERLVALRARLGSLEKIRISLEAARARLEGMESEGILSGLQNLQRELRPLENFGEDFAQSLRISEEASALLLELQYRIEKLVDGLEADPAALESAEAKLSVLNRLKRKYNLDVTGLIGLWETARAELEALGRAEGTTEELNLKVLELEERLRLQARKLHARRMEASAELEKAWQRDIRALGMNRARLQLACEEKDLSPSGLTQIAALFSANPGESPKALGRVASGGELSRIMLALKNIVAGRSEIGVYLFDEVDAGIGGETAQAVGDRLRRLAHQNQVLVVTHLAQIAAKAHAQYGIEKQTERGRTRTLVAELGPRERERELARMLGDTGSEAAKRLARELLNRGASLSPAGA